MNRDQIIDGLVKNAGWEQLLNILNMLGKTRAEKVISGLILADAAGRAGAGGLEWYKGTHYDPTQDKDLQKFLETQRAAGKAPPAKGEPGLTGKAWETIAGNYPLWDKAPIGVNPLGTVVGAGAGVGLSKLLQQHRDKKNPGDDTFYTNPYVMGALGGLTGAVVPSVFETLTSNKS